MKINNFINKVKKNDIIEKKLILSFIDEVIKKINLNNNIYIYKLNRVQYIKESLKINNQFKFTDEETILEIILWYYNLKKINIPEWLIIKFKEFYNIKKIHYYKIEDLKHIGYETIDIVTDSVLLSAKEIDNYTVKKNDIDKWLKIRESNDDLFIGMFLAGMLIGHLGAVALNKEEYFKMKKGDLIEDEIISSSNSIKNINYIYIPTIVIKKEFRRPLLTRDLIFEFIQLIFNQNNLKVLKSIIVNVYTKEGKYLCDKLGFEFLTNHDDGGEVYELILLNNINLLEYVKKLKIH